MVSTIKSILIIAVCICFNNQVMAQVNQKCMLLSDGSQLRDIVFTKDIIHNGSVHYKQYGLRNVTWPSYSTFTEQLFFEAYSNGKSGIYRVNISEFKEKPELLSLGKYPSLSHDGKSIAYLDAHNKLVFTDISTGKTELVNDSMPNQSIWKRPVWLSNNTLIYISENDKVSSFNCVSHSQEILFNQKLLPLVSNSEQVLFTDQDAKKIFVYQSGKLNIIWESNFLTVGPSVMLTSDGFVYSRQTWAKVLSLSENKSIFYYSNRNNNEIKLVSDLSLFGGTLIPCGIIHEN